MSNKNAINKQLNSYLSHKRKKQRINKKPWFAFFKKKKEEPEDIPLEKIRLTLEKSGVDTEDIESFEKNKVKKMDEVNLSNDNSKVTANVEPTVSAPKSELTQAKDEELDLEEEEYDEETSEKENKESFFQKIGKMFSFGKKKDLKEEYEDADSTIENASVQGLNAQEIIVNDESLREDLKKSLKITFDVMQRLPQAQFDRYKDSENFKEYKKMLDKHKIKQL